MIVDVQSVPEVWEHAAHDGTYVVNVVLRFPATSTLDALIRLGTMLDTGGVEL